jgi:hypothetical protein
MQRHLPPTGPAGPRPGIRRRASARPDSSPSLLRRARDAHVAATVLGVLAGLGLIGATLSFTVDLFIAPWRIFTADVEESLHLVASLVGLAGAFQLYRGASRGRVVVLLGLALNVAATLVFSRNTLASPDTLAPMLTWLTLAVWTVVCRLPGPQPWTEADRAPPPPPGTTRYPWPQPPTPTWPPQPPTWPPQPPRR